MNLLERKCWRCGLGGDLVEPMSNSPEHRTPSECIRAANQEIGRLTSQLAGAVARVAELEAEVADLRAEKRAYRAVGDEMVAELDRLTGGK